MGGKAHGGRRIESLEALQLFNFLMVEVGQSDESGIITDAELAGSYRRGKTDCGDLDIVIIPNDQEAFDAFCSRKFGHLKNGKPKRTGLFDGVQVEFYVATPDNWGSQLQMWTGSWRHNQKLRALAKAQGLSLSQYGFKNRETKELVKACPLEGDVYAYLGLDFVVPEDR